MRRIVLTLKWWIKGPYRLAVCWDMAREDYLER